MPDDARLPTVSQEPLSLKDVGGSALPPSLQILLDEGLYTRMKQLSILMSKAEGFTPKHLIGKGEACFAIINTALDWKLNPHFVARHTYQTPGGSIGFDGALVQSVLERSGRFIGAPEFEYHGDWQKIAGKFEKKTSARGGEYVAATWTDDDAIGLGIIVRWQVKGEAKPRVWPGETTPFWVTQCFPRNSPLWATDPKTQIAYLAIRRFANLAAPGILGAASFDYDDMIAASDIARDVTPSRPRPEDFVDEIPTPPTQSFEIFDFVGEPIEFPTAEQARDALLEMMGSAKSRKALDAVWESNTASGLVDDIRTAIGDGAEPLHNAYHGLVQSFEQPNPGNRQDRPAPGAQPLDPARDATDTAEVGRTEHPEEQSQSSTSTERRSSPPISQAETVDSALRDEPKSLAVPVRKPVGKAADWQGTAEDMVLVIKKLTDPEELTPTGAFVQANRSALNNMRDGEKSAWITVMYELGQRERALRTGEQ